MSFCFKLSCMYMLEKDSMLISGIFSSFGYWIEFEGETSNASLLIDSCSRLAFFSLIQPLNRTDSKRHIITVFTILFLDTILFSLFTFSSSDYINCQKYCYC